MKNYKQSSYDAIVVGSGPNGFAAAITLARENLSVVLLEGKSTIGGGMRSAELTLPGFTHDICSAVHPLAISSPFFRTLPLSQFGLEWVHPDAPLAHPFNDGDVITLERSLDATCGVLGEDGEAYRNLMQPLVENWDKLAPDLLAPLHIPSHPIDMARFSYHGIQSAERLARKLFKNELTRGFFAGLAAHSILPLDKYLTAGFGLVLAILGHAVGWPIARGGSQSIANALEAYFLSIGGEIITDMNIETIDQLPKAKAILFDVAPKQLLKIVGDRFPQNYKRKLEEYRYGPGVFKMDWALNNPIPWQVQECARAGTVHLGGTLATIAKSEREIWEGKNPENHFILLSQPTLFDSTRAPPGKHIAWAYCHVPNGSTLDMTKRIEYQIDQYAPGFYDSIIGRNVMSTVDLEAYNPNYVGGDINGGAADIQQFFTRPTARIVPYSTPLKGVYICSSSTPPGGGVHGMCGYHAAQAALKQCFKRFF